MFKSVNDMVNEMKAETANNRFIVESVVGDDTIPFPDDEEEAIVDSGSVGKETLRKVDKFLDKIVSSDKYDDSDINDLLDDEDEEELEGLIDAEDLPVE